MSAQNYFPFENEKAGPAQSLSYPSNSPVKKHQNFLLDEADLETLESQATFSPIVRETTYERVFYLLSNLFWLLWVAQAGFGIWICFKYDLYEQILYQTGDCLWAITGGEQLQRECFSESWIYLD